MHQNRHRAYQKSSFGQKKTLSAVECGPHQTVTISHLSCYIGIFPFSEGVKVICFPEVLVGLRGLLIQPRNTWFDKGNTTTDKSLGNKPRMRYWCNWLILADNLSMLTCFHFKVPTKQFYILQTFQLPKTAQLSRLPFSQLPNI